MKKRNLPKVGNFRNVIHHCNLLRKYYRFSGPYVSPGVVYVIDDYKFYHGGIADVVKQILGIYAFCTKHEIQFNLVFQYSFNIQKYLIPRFDFILDNIESRNLFYSRPLYIGKKSLVQWEKKLRKSKYFQLHTYGNTIWHPYKDIEVGHLFHELFIPCDEIQKEITRYRSTYEKWDSLTFRFQNLLNDFSEPVRTKDLDKSGISDLIEECLTYVKNYCEQSDNLVLITTDSQTFLEVVKTIPKVIVVDGNISHVNFYKSITESSVLKSFLDFFMIAEADRCYSVGTDFMYPTGFPQLAALINNKPFDRIVI